MAAFAILGLMLALMQAAEPADPAAVFGNLFTFVIILDVINTLVALYFLWRIWFREPRARSS